MRTSLFVSSFIIFKMREQSKAAYRGKTLFWIIFVLCLSMHTILIASIRLYPFLDTPNHLAMATIYRYYGQPGNHFTDYYLIDTFLKPNVFHLFFCSSKLFPSVEFANKSILLPLRVAISTVNPAGHKKNRWQSVVLSALLFISLQHQCPVRFQWNYYRTAVCDVYLLLYA